MTLFQHIAVTVVAVFGFPVAAYLQARTLLGKVSKDQLRRLLAYHAPFGGIVVSVILWSQELRQVTGIQSAPYWVGALLIIGAISIARGLGFRYLSRLPKHTGTAPRLPISRLLWLGVVGVWALACIVGSIVMIIRNP